MIKAVELFEMNIPRDAAIMRIVNLEDQINSHLIKLLAMQADDSLHTHWKRELRAWFHKIAGFRLKGKGKSSNRPPSAKLYYDCLYDHVFGGHESQNVNSIINLLVEDNGYVRNNRPIEEITAIMRKFHHDIATKMASGEPIDDLIAAL